MAGTAEQATKLAAIAADILPDLGYQGDYSLESLRDIDTLIEENSAEGQPTPNGVLAQSTDYRLVCMGCYVGEVLIRAFGGTWNGELEDNSVDAWMHLGVAVGGVVAHPISKVYKRFRYGSEDSVYGLGVLVAGLAGGGSEPPKPKKGRRGKRPRS